mgnify:CR=1 FL=1
MKHFIILILFTSFISSCSRNSNNRSLNAEDVRKFEERNIEINKEIVKRKQDTIQSFIALHKWDMKKTGSGLWYYIKTNGNNDSIKSGDFVEFSYTVSLLNGKVCYSSDSLGRKTIKVGQGGIESGVEEALLMMHKGDSARLLIPPHLAHGLIGDQNKIPKLAILNYTLVITNYKKKE